MAVVLGFLACTHAPLARAESATVHVHVTLYDFRYYEDLGSCHGGLEGYKNEGFDPTVAVALEGVNTRELSLGTASDKSEYNVYPDLGQKSCYLDAYVTVDNPDTEYRLKWGSRPWERETFTAVPSVAGSEVNDYILVQI
ncbi:hypothetical protein AB0K11_24705 [Mycobacterium sp. NPDC050551]|uniref:hypothetical protein n=1 Tax=Mycobacterium sp. NPDC050551 TaxID=3155407 RepID=UPI00341C28DE